MCEFQWENTAKHAGSSSDSSDSWLGNHSLQLLCHFLLVAWRYLLRSLVERFEFSILHSVLILLLTSLSVGREFLWCQAFGASRLEASKASLQLQSSPRMVRWSEIMDGRRFDRGRIWMVWGGCERLRLDWDLKTHELNEGLAWCWWWSRFSLVWQFVALLASGGSALCLERYGFCRGYCYRWFFSLVSHF